MEAMIPQLETHQLSPDVTVVNLSGSLAMGNALHQVENQMRQLISANAPRFIMDLSRLEYVDSAGIGVIVMASGQIASAGGKLRVVGASGRVQQLIEITHLERLVSLHPDLESAVASFQQEAGRRN